MLTSTLPSEPSAMSEGQDCQQSPMLKTPLPSKRNVVKNPNNFQPDRRNVDIQLPANGSSSTCTSHLIKFLHNPSSQDDKAKGRASSNDRELETDKLQLVCLAVDAALT